jgi:HEAT repeat protein
VPEITPAQAEEVMVEAIVALGVTGADEARPILQNLAESDASLKVRQAALEALKALS